MIQVHIIFWKHINAIDQTCNVIVMTRKYKTEPTTFVDVVSFLLTLPSVDMLGSSICVSGCNVRMVDMWSHSQVNKGMGNGNQDSHLCTYENNGGHN